MAPILPSPSLLDFCLGCSLPLYCRNASQRRKKRAEEKRVAAVRLRGRKIRNGKRKDTQRKTPAPPPNRKKKRRRGKTQTTDRQASRARESHVEEGTGRELISETTVAARRASTTQIMVFFSLPHLLLLSCSCFALYANVSRSRRSRASAFWCWRSFPTSRTLS